VKKSLSRLSATVCCSVLQCCCSLLQCVAVRYNVLQCVAVCCNVLQCVAVRCNVLQRVAVRCNVLQCVAVCCNVLQCVTVCCSVSPAKKTGSRLSERVPSLFEKEKKPCRCSSHGLRISLSCAHVFMIHISMIVCTLD